MSERTTRTHPRQSERYTDAPGNSSLGLPRRCFYRAPVDNDKGGVEKHVKSALIRRLFVRENAYSFEGLWEKYGLDRACRDESSVRVRRENNGLLNVSYDVVVGGKSRGTKPLFKISLIYEFLPHEIGVHVRVRAMEPIRGLKTLARVRRGACVVQVLFTDSSGRGLTGRVRAGTLSLVIGCGLLRKGRWVAFCSRRSVD